MLQNEVGHVDYGTYNALFSLCSLFSVFYDLGLSHFSAQNISKDNTLFNKLFPSLFLTRLFALLFFPFFISFCGYLLGYEAKELWWLFLLAVSANLFHFALFFRAKLQAFQYFKFDAIASVLQKLLLIIIVVILFGYGIDIEKYIIVEVITHVLVFGILFITVIKLFGWIKLKFDFSGIKTVIIGALPFAVMTLLYSLSAKIDVVMLERMLGEGGGEAGLYYGAVRLFDAGMMYPWAIMPMFFAKFAAFQSNKFKAEDLMRVGTIVMFIPILALGTIFIFESKPLFALFKNSSEKEVTTMINVLAILAFAFILHGLSVVFGTYLNASGFVKKVNKWVAFSLAINIIINWFFIPKYGAVATAWSTVISTFVLFIGYIILIKKDTLVSINVQVLIRLIILGIVLLSSVYFFKFLEFWWLYNWIFIGISTILLSFFAGLWNKKLYQLEE